MHTIQILDNISPKGLELFDSTHYKLGHDIKNPDVILVRSHKLHEHHFLSGLKAVGRAGVGTDNIPVAKLTELGIPVFYAPGANANAVKELVLAAMLVGYRHMDEARIFLSGLTKHNSDTLAQDIESQKKNFVGHEISGKTLGIVGLGHIGVLIANAALGLGMKVLGYDPNMTVPNALALMPGVEILHDLNSLLASADIITLHVPLNNDTTHLINKKNISLLKPQSLLLNFSREKVVDEEAVREQLNNRQLLGYITDFPTLHLADHPGVLCFPHIGASTVEAEENSARMVISNIRDYLESGTIKHSINFPDTSLSASSVSHAKRMLIINQHLPGTIAQITQFMSQFGYNIERMINASQAAIAVNLIEITGPEKNLDALTQSCLSITSVLSVRLI